MKNCQWCDHTFESTVSYQIYCSSECRESATREKIAARYLITRRQKRLGKTRQCKNCKKDLSIYNDTPLCFDCNINPLDVAKAIKQIKGIANGKE
jgi:hypothetical protein